MPQTTPPSVGDPAPDLTLPTVDDEAFVLAERQHEAVWISFLRHAG